MISLKKFQKNISFKKKKVTVIGEIRLEKMIHLCYKKGYTGLEFLTGIPAYTLSSIACNTGVGKLSICDFLSDIFYIDRNGISQHLKKKEIFFSYRKGPLDAFGIIYKAIFELDHSSPALISKKILEQWNYRKKTQPLHLPSLGCVFKNPSQDIPAGKLIDTLQLKGQSVGGIAVSQQHANFFINRGNGSSKDFYSLINDIREKVQKKMGIDLKLEIKIVRTPL